MRFSFLLFILSISSCISAQDEKKGLRLWFLDCRNNPKESSWTDPKLRIYKLPGNLLVHQKKSSHWDNTGDIIIKNFKAGKYRIEYDNRYRQRVSRVYTLKGTYNELDFCQDELEPGKTMNSLSEMKIGDSIVVNYHTVGCEHFSRIRLVINRDSNQVSAIVYGRQYAIDNVRQDTITQRLILTQDQQQAFTRFENELQFAYDRGCTTTDDYEFIVNGETRKYIDGTCKWYGFQYLLEKFVGEKYIRLYYEWPY
jgi:hypothetical protein